MESTIAYKTMDGKFFLSMDEAEKHESELLFDEWYSENIILGNYEGSKVYCADIKEWLVDNKEMILKFLGN